MRSTKDSGFILAMVVIAAAIGAAAWFFLIGPAMTARTEAEAAELAARDFNETLEIQLLAYEEAAEDLPDLKAQIADIRVQLAPQEDVAAVRKVIDAVLAAESLEKVSDSAGIPILVLPGSVVLEPAAFAVGRTSYTDPLAFQNLYSTSMDMEVTGQYASIVRAVAKLQMGEDRFLLVRNLTIEAVPEELEGTYRSRFELVFFTLVDPTGAIDPGTNSGNVDPDSGETVPDVQPGDALTPRIPWVAE